MEPRNLPGGVALGVKVDARVTPKPHVRVVPRGTLVAAQDGEVVVFDDERPDEALLDFAVFVIGIYAEPTGVLTADSKPRGAAITLAELCRADFQEFKRRGKALLFGQSDVPGFNEVPGTWATLHEKT